MPNKQAQLENPSPLSQSSLTKSRAPPSTSRSQGSVAGACSQESSDFGQVCGLGSRVQVLGSVVPAWGLRLLRHQL